MTNPHTRDLSAARPLGTDRVVLDVGFGVQMWHPVEQRMDEVIQQASGLARAMDR